VQRSRRVPNASRRAVFARDGLRCTWRGPDGTRCVSRAWLEHDHVTPRGRGGGDEPANGRIFCRAHNRLAAEQAYGQNTIEKIISRRQAARHRSDTATENGTEEASVR
jgi:5-methylcytosine-specific restriction endonuclease McrA